MSTSIAQLIETTESTLRGMPGEYAEEIAKNQLKTLCGQTDAQADAIILSAKTNIELKMQQVRQLVAANGAEEAFVDPLPEVPAAMKATRQWVRWRLEPGSNGKMTKVPYRVDGKGKASSTNPNDWGDYQTAVNGETNSNEGPGFMFANGFAGIDLDGCRNPKTGEVAQWADDIINALENAYVEISPSGTGLHIIVLATIPGKDQVFNLNPAIGFGDKVKIEIYDQKRYFTVTGNPYFEDAGDVVECDLTNVYQLFHDIRAKNPAPESPKKAGSDAGEPTKIELLGTFGTTKYDIFTNGQIESRAPFIISNRIGRLTYSSQSEADMGFCTVMAVEFDGDVKKIDDAMRQSPLYRDKWERQDYSKNTIEKAVVSAKTLKEKQQTAPLTQQEQQPAEVVTLPDDDPTWEFAITREEYDAEIEKEFPVLPLKLGPGPTWDDDIMHGICGDIVLKACTYNEAHPAGMYLDLLVSLGSIIGRGPYFNVNSTQHHPNEFVVRVGDSAISRKGTGREAVNEVLKMTDPEWYQTRVVSGFGSAEAIINEVRDESWQQVRKKKTTNVFENVRVPGISDKRLMIREGELASIFQLAGKPESRADVVLRDGWDSLPLRNLVKGKSDGLSNSNSCQFPHISVSADTTRDELLRKMPEGAALNGFGNRFLYCYVRRVKMCPNGGPGIDWANELMRLNEVIRSARDLQYVGMQKSASKVWNRMYPEIEKSVASMPVVASSMCGRAVAHVRRLALIFCLLDGQDTVETQHLHAAKRIWDYCQDSVRLVFSGTTADQERILQWLMKTGPVTVPQITQQLFHKNKKSDWVRVQVNGLSQAGKVIVQGDVISAKP